MTSRRPSRAAVSWRGEAQCRGSSTASPRRPVGSPTLRATRRSRSSAGGSVLRRLPHRQPGTFSVHGGGGCWSSARATSGFPLAMRAVEAGFDVVGYDVDEPRVKRLTAGESYVEDIPAERLAAALGDRPLPRVRRPTTAPASTSPSSRCRRRCARARPTSPTSRRPRSHSAPTSRPGATVILESTTYPGTTEELVAPDPRGRVRPRRRRRLPPRLQPRAHRPGQPDVDASRTRRRSCRASTTASLARGAGVLRRARRRTVPVSSPEEAELTKLLENTFRHVNIALVNELAMFADDLGIDVWEAIDAASTKPFGYMRFTPGPGVGGHCLPVDPSYLSWRVRPHGSASVPVRRARQRRQRAHARLRRAPARGTRSTDRGHQRPNDLLLGWRTSGTPATPASRASIASQMSMPRSCAYMASSLTSAMFT